MARKSRKNIEKIKLLATEKSYRAAIYVRLSAEDERKIESESVENQIKFLRGYLSGKEDIVEHDLYVDRGITGTKFDRPEFNRMMDDMRAGKFNCIVVKDLSRFGRNYLETGNYLESIFPIFGIRFISVTDDYDSLTAKPTDDGLIVPLKNLINEAYAKDISQKACASKRIRQKKGEFVGSRAPYGYIIDPEKPGHLLVDEEVKPVVVRIFEERAAGKSSEKIAAGLNRDGIPCPSRYRYEKGEGKYERFKNSLWSGSVVRGMFLKRVYNGDLQQGRTRQALYKNMPVTKVPKEEQILVENTHEPLVSKELFAKVQAINEKTYKRRNEIVAKIVPVKKPENYISGISFCGECGGKLQYRVFARAHGRKDFGYVCHHAREYVGVCSHKFIRKDDMDAVLEKVISDHIKIYEMNVDELKRLNAGEGSIRIRKDYADDLRRLKDDLARTEDKSGKLYGDFADGIMTEKEYLFARDNTYRRKEEELKKAIEEKVQEAGRYAVEYKGDKDMAAAFDSVKGMKVLSSEVTHALIERVDFYGKGRVEIKFRFRDELDALICEVAERQGDEK